jgi:hypothetical protein
MDWLTAGAVHLLERKTVFSDGAGALYLRREPGMNPLAQLKTVSNAHLFSNSRTRFEAIKLARAELNGPQERTLLADGLQGVPRADREEQIAWSDWGGQRTSVKTILGEALMASAAWQCVAAVDALVQKAYDAANVSVAGTNQQAIAAQFVGCSGGL